MLQRAISSASSDSNESNEDEHKNGQPDKKAKLSTIDKDKSATVSKEHVKSKTKPNDEGNPKKEVKTTTVKDMLRDKRDNKRNIAEAVNGVKSGQTATTTEDSSSSSDSSDSSDDEEEEIGNETDGNVEGAIKNIDKVPEKLPTDAPSTSNLPVASNETNGEPAVKLPENLPENLRQKIQQMEDLAKSTTKVLADNESQALLYEYVQQLALSSTVLYSLLNYLHNSHSSAESIR